MFYPELISLYNLLHVQDKEISIPDKLLIAKAVCESLAKIHECVSKTVHAHLSSRNLFVDRVVADNQIRFRVKVGDLGDMCIRQSAKIFLSYDVRNTWSSPEVIGDPNLAFTSRRTTMDIYSYGMLLWELFSAVVPFADNTDAAKTFIVDKNFRPKIRYLIFSL